MSRLKVKNITKKRLEKFDFRFLRQIKGHDLFEIVNAKEWAKDVEAQKPHVIYSEYACFWTNEGDYTTKIFFKDILPY